MGGQRKAPVRLATQPGQAGSVLVAHHTKHDNVDATQPAHWGAIVLFWFGLGFDLDTAREFATLAWGRR